MPDHIPLAAQIEAFRETYDKFLSDGKLTPIEGMILVGKFGEIIDHAAHTFIGDNAHFEAEIQSARGAYNQYVLPLDIPGVWNAVEPLVKQGAWAGIEASLRELRKKAIANNPELAQGA